AGTSIYEKHAVVQFFECKKVVSNRRRSLLTARTRPVLFRVPSFTIRAVSFCWSNLYKWPAAINFPSVRRTSPTGLLCFPGLSWLQLLCSLFQTHFRLVSLSTIKG